MCVCVGGCLFVRALACVCVCACVSVCVSAPACASACIRAPACVHMYVRLYYTLVTFVVIDGDVAVPNSSCVALQCVVMFA